MRRLAATSALVLAAALAAALAASAQPPSGVVRPKAGAGMSPAELGAQLFAANCASCHGAGGRGVSESAPQAGAGGIAGYGPDLRRAGALAADFYLRTGRMPLSDPQQIPARGEPSFDRREIRALVAYVASLGHGPPIPHPRPAGADRLAEGMSLFTERCAGCHQVVGEGGYVTDAAVPVLQHASARDIAEAVRIGPYLMPRFSRRDLSGRELSAVIAYVLASQHPEDRGGIGIGHIGPVPEGMVSWFVAAVVLVAVCALIGGRSRREGPR